MGLLNWVTKGLGEWGSRLSAPQQSQPPTFERLEPRVLLSADASSVSEIHPLDTQPYEQVISVDLEPGFGAGEVVASGEWLVASEAEDDGLEGRKVGSEEEKTESSGTVGQSDSPTVERSDSLSVSQLASAANLSYPQDVEAFALVEMALVSSDSTVTPSYGQTVIPFDATLGSINPRGPPTEIVFIDSRLSQDSWLNIACSQNVAVNVLPGDTNGIQYITDTLSDFDSLSAIHIISHGAPGQVVLGTGVLRSSSLNSYAESLGVWGNSLSAEGDILLYGCSVGKGQMGRGFIQRIDELTGADVAASVDPTGATGLGGDWILEYAAGSIEAELPFACMLASYDGILEILFSEDFETNGEGTRYSTQGFASSAVFHNGDNDYFIRFQDTGAGPSPVISLDADPNGQRYSGFNGSCYWAAEDVDDAGPDSDAASPGGDSESFKVIDFNSTNTAAYHNLQFSGLFGAGGNDAVPAYDSDSFLAILYSTDGGSTYIPGLVFRSQVTALDASNHPLRQVTAIAPSGANGVDTLADLGEKLSAGTVVRSTGMAGVFSYMAADTDGTAAAGSIPGNNAPVLQPYGFPIPNAADIRLRLVLQLNDGNAEAAFDYLRLTGDLAASNKAPSVLSSSASDVGTLEIGDSSYSFTVTYSDDSAIDVSTIGIGGVGVSGPGGSLTLADATPDIGTDGTPRTVTYVAVPPDGSWNAADNGTYAVTQVAGQVGDNGTPQLFVPAGAITTFDVNAISAAPTATNMTRIQTYTEGDVSVALDAIVVTNPDTEEAISATLTLNNTAAGSLTASSGNGETYTQGTGVWTVTSAVANVNAALAAVSFVPVAGNTLDTTVTTHIESASGTGPIDGTITLDVTVLPRDFGDAPRSDQSGFTSSYPSSTVTSTDPARHVATGPRLGADRDAEADGLPDANALGDDQDNSDDEGGITFVTSALLVSSSSNTIGSIQVSLQNADASSNRLDAWIDLNQDGDWADTGEQIFANRDLGTANGAQTLSFTLPAGAGVGDTYARFRLSTTGGLNPTGIAQDGEVEDYLITTIGSGAGADVTVHLPAHGGTTEAVVQNDRVVVRRDGIVFLEAAAGSLNKLTINGTAGDNDTFRIDLSTPGLPDSVIINGGDEGFDALEITGGLADTASYSFQNLHDGSILVDGQAITYTRLEPITSTISAANVILNYSAASETIIITDAGAGQTTVDSTAGEITTFTHPTGALTINGGAGDDDIDISSLAADYPAHVTINGQGDTDTVTFDGNVSLASDKHLSVTADTIHVNSGMSTTGAGSVTLEAGRNIDMNSGSSISTVDGGITLEANPAGVVVGSFVGIDVDGAVVTTTGAGPITIHGRGGDTSSDDGIAIDDSSIRTVNGDIQMTGNAGAGTGSSDGVDIGSDSVIESTGTGSIGIEGRSGSGRSSDGVEISDTSIRSVDGAIDISGDASYADSSCDGVEIDDSLVESVSAAVQITGDSRYAGSSADGVDINDSLIRSATGHIEVRGTATGAGSSADGVELAGGALIQTTDSGPVTVTGVGQLDGVYMTGTATEVSSVQGAISIHGTGGGLASSEGVHITGDLATVTSAYGDIRITGDSGGDDDGVEIHNGAVIGSTGTGGDAATISISGTGGSGTTDYGVELVGAGTVVTSVDGNIQIVGTSPGGDGVYIGGEAVISSTGIGLHAARIEIQGTGGGVSSSEGVMVSGIGTAVTSVEGDIHITGASAGDDDGIEIHNGALVSSTGTGPDAASITVTGTGGGGTTDYGVELADAGTTISSTDGNISIAGTSPGGDGVYIGSGAVISSTGTGPDAAHIDIQGTGGGVSSSEGIMVTGIGTEISTIDGDIQISGDSGGDDDGIEIHNGALVSSTGTGPDAASITISGTGGSGTTDYGVELADAGTSISSIHGNIHIAGTSLGGDGVYIGSGAVVSSTGTGPDPAEVDIEGTGGGLSSNEGVHITGTDTLVTSIDGDIRITGDSGGDDDGVEIDNGAQISSTGTGAQAANITIVGIGDSGSGDYGVEISSTGTNISSVAGQIDITGTSAVAEGISIGTGASIVVTGVNGDVTLTANDLALTGTVNAGAGQVTILPSNPGLSFDLGSASGSGQFVITDAEFDRIFTADKIQIGDATAGTITFTDTVDPMGADTLELTSGSAVADANTSGYDFVGSQLILNGTLAPGQSPGVFRVDGSVILKQGHAFQVEIGGASPGTDNSDHDQLAVTGTVTIENDVALDLQAFDGYVPGLGDTFVIVDNEGSDAIVGVFDGLPEGTIISDFLGSGLSAVITYQGADGNDVVITVPELRLSLAPASILEDGGQTLGFVFSRLGDTAVPLTVFFSVAGSADLGTDYTANGAHAFSAVAGQVNFLSGMDKVTVAVEAVADTMVEADETVHITVDPGPDYNVDAAGDAVGTILNDDTATLSLEDVARSEDSGHLHLKVTLSNDVQGGLKVQKQTSNGTATLADGDYQYMLGTLNFAGYAGETHGFKVRIIPDSKVEADETLIVSLKNVQTLGAGVNAANIDATDTALGTILNDDTATLTLADVAKSEDSAYLQFKVTLSNDVQGGLKVRKQTSDGTATLSDDDYQYMLGTLSFTGYAGETHGCSVRTTPDSKVEAHETFAVSLKNVQTLGAGVNAANIDVTDTAIGTILNDDTAVLTIADIAQPEDSGSPMTFTVILSHAVQGGLTVDYQTADRSATTGDNDYNSAAGTLSFTGLAGETHTFTVDIIADGKVEFDEVFTISWSNVQPQAAGVDPADIDATHTALGTIRRDDGNDITDLVSMDEVQVMYDHQTGQKTVDVIIINRGGKTLYRPLQLIVEVEDTDGSVVSLGNGDGLTFDGKSYVDITDLTADGQMDPGELLRARLVFDNGAISFFDYTLSLRGMLVDQAAPVDTVAPQASVDPLATYDPTPALTGTVDDTQAAVDVWVEGRRYATLNHGDGTWRTLDVIHPALTPGQYDVSVRATDPAGNTSQGNFTDALTILAVPTVQLSNSPTVQPSDRPTVEPEPLNDLVEINVLRQQYDHQSGQVTVGALITNRSGRMIRGPIQLAVEQVSAPIVTLANPDGQTSNGLDYMDLASSLNDSRFESGESIFASPTFNNAARCHFHFKLGVYAVLDLDGDDDWPWYWV